MGGTAPLCSAHEHRCQRGTQHTCSTQSSSRSWQPRWTLLQTLGVTAKKSITHERERESHTHKGTRTQIKGSQVFSDGSAKTKRRKAKDNGLCFA